MREEAQTHRVYRDGQIIDTHDHADIIPRAQWGAVYGRGNANATPKSLVVLHHAESPNIPCGVSQARERDAVLGIERYHVEHNGWQGIGYNFLVFQSGRIYEGRGWDRVGAHTAGHNSRSVGICLVINADTTPPHDAIIEAVQNLIGTGIRLGKIEPLYELKGHRDYASTRCPGRHVYTMLGSFRP